MPETHVHFRSLTDVFAGKHVRRVKKQWGEEHWIVNREYCGKKLILKKDRRCSIHVHKKKDEVFYIQKGKVLLELDGKECTLGPGDFAHVRQGVHHRFTGLEDSEIFEFSTHHSEGDSFRSTQSGHIDPDRYNRQTTMLQSFSKQRILVVGDVMLDRYTKGSVDRVSPEAPIPVVLQRTVSDVPGGAANNAANIASLGAKSVLASVCGSDDTAGALSAHLKSRAVRVSFVKDANRPTTLKHRIVGNNDQQIVRIDHEVSDGLDAKIEAKLIAQIKALSQTSDAILVADYAKGVMTPKVYAAVYVAARKRKIPVIVDPKPTSSRAIDAMQKATIVTPNIKEARILLDDHGSSADKIGTKLSKNIQGHLLLTRGSDGMDLYHSGKQIVHFDSLSSEVADVSGAGDTVAATLAIALAAGASIEDAVDLANRAASVVVGKHGTATLDLQELDAAL